MHAPSMPRTGTLTGITLIKSSAVMATLGYSDRSSFWTAVKAAGIPFVRINSRNCVFEESALRAWIKSRTVGGAS
jgi:predicted DNA-binding transcriptional regulator AlpA